MGRKSIFIFFPFLFIYLIGCDISADSFSLAPYKLEGCFVCDKDSCDYKKGAIKCNFQNLSEKTVTGLYIVFSLFDNFGEPLQQNAIDVMAYIPPSENGVFTVSLDNYLPENEEEKYYVDFIYASKIIYEDGAQWTDPLGLKKVN